MGYRALLKNYLRHLMRAAGTHYLDGAARVGFLSPRDIAELRLLAAEADREDGRLRREAREDPDHERTGQPNNE